MTLIPAGEVIVVLSFLLLLFQSCFWAIRLLDMSMGILYLGRPIVRTLLLLAFFIQLGAISVCLHILCSVWSNL